MAERTLDAPAYLAALRQRIPRVAEFRRLREEAKKLGLRLWLFGGTAAAFAHYVREAELFVQGDSDFQEQHFDDDFTNIFRSTQDLDVAADDRVPSDAPTHLERLKALQRIVNEDPSLRYFRGARSAWEVRSLRYDNGKKMAIHGNRHYLDQDLDSHSTGIIEVTDPPPGEPILRDVKDWDNAQPAFLTDVLTKKLRYYWSAAHFETARAADGLNPRLIAVTRLLTKAFQYELTMTDGDWSRLETEVRNFDPARDLTTDYARNWFEEHGQKLYLHASNLLFARQQLDRIGLRAILIALKNNPEERGSLAWLLEKSPLPTMEVGLGDGETADSLGLTTVAHDTTSFLVYESICRSRRGIPNIFQSRAPDASHPKGYVGETASKGTGFYVRKGHVGARNSGITIRFRMNANARRGHDFDVYDDEIVVHNRAALTVIAESLQLTPIEYLQILENPEFQAANELGAREKLRRRSAHHLALATDGDRQAFYQHGLTLLGRLKEKLAAIAFDEWIEIATPAQREAIALTEQATQAFPQGVQLELYAKLVLTQQPARTAAMFQQYFPHAMAHPPWPALLNILRYGDTEVLTQELREGPVARHLALLLRCHTMTSDPRIQRWTQELKTRVARLSKAEIDSLALRIPEIVASLRGYGTEQSGAIRVWSSLHDDPIFAMGRLARAGFLEKLDKEHYFFEGLERRDFRLPPQDPDGPPQMYALYAAGVPTRIVYKIFRGEYRTHADSVKWLVEPRMALASTPQEVYEAAYEYAAGQGGGHGRVTAARLRALRASAGDYRRVACIPWTASATAGYIAAEGALLGMPSDGDWLAIFDPAPERRDSCHHHLEYGLTATLLHATPAMLRAVDSERLTRVVRSYDCQEANLALARVRQSTATTLTPGELLRRWAPWPTDQYASDQYRQWTIAQRMHDFFSQTPNFHQVRKLLAIVQPLNAPELTRQLRKRAVAAAHTPDHFIELFACGAKNLPDDDIAILQHAVPAFLRAGATAHDVKRLEAATTRRGFSPRMHEFQDQLYTQAWAHFSGNAAEQCMLADPWWEKHPWPNYRSQGGTILAPVIEGFLRSGPPLNFAARLRKGLEIDAPKTAAIFDAHFTALFAAEPYARLLLQELKGHPAAASFATAVWPAYTAARPDGRALRTFLRAAGPAQAALRKALPEGLSVQSSFAEVCGRALEAAMRYVR